MSAEMDQETREHLHFVLLYMLESEAKGFYQTPEDERKHWAYQSARFLMRRFDFEDLLEEDTAMWQRNELAATDNFPP